MKNEPASHGSGLATTFLGILVLVLMANVFAAHAVSPRDGARPAVESTASGKLAANEPR